VAVAETPVPVVEAGKLVKPESVALTVVSVAVAEEASEAEVWLVRGARMLLKRSG